MAGQHRHENMDNATAREFVSDIGNEAERLSRITEDLLRLTRLDSGVWFEAPSRTPRIAACRLFSRRVSWRANTALSMTTRAAMPMEILSRVPYPDWTS